MHSSIVSLPRSFSSFLAILVLLPASFLAAQRIERPVLTVSAYTIDAELDPSAHHIQAKVTVTFTAPDNSDLITFGFHPGLKISKITDDSGKLLTGERTADGSVRIQPNAPVSSAMPSHWTFEYDGVITGNEDGPIEGLKLAAIQEPITYLFYSARWFPATGYLINRFTAQIHIRVPQGMRVFASGQTGSPHNVSLTSGKPGDQYDFNWSKPGFPGTVIAGRYVDPATAGPIKVYLTVSHRSAAEQLAQTAAKEFDYFTESFGQPEVTHVNVIELPDDTLPAVWAPELAAIMGSRTGDKSGIRLLANTLARQW
jgi:hypothetical protein